MTSENNKQRGQEALAELDKALKSRDRSERNRPLGVIIIAVLVILAIVGAIFYLTTREDKSDADNEAKTNSTNADGTVFCAYNKNGEAAKEAPIPNGDNVSAQGTLHLNLVTTQGEIGLDLDRSKSPCTVNAMESLAKAKYFDNTVCHRMTQGDAGLSVLQCGDPSASGSGGPGFKFANEYPTTDKDAAGKPYTYARGTVAMANSGPDTNGSQFFLNLKDNQLPADYTEFGTVDEKGMKTLDEIAKAGVKDNKPDGEPAKEVRITSATVK